MKRIIVFITLIYVPLITCKTYTNYTLYRSVPFNKNHLKFFYNLSDKYDVNFWREPGRLNKPVDFIISPADNSSFIKEAEEYGLNLSTIMTDVQSALDQQSVAPYTRRKASSFDWQHYYRIDDMYNWLWDLSIMYPRNMRMINIGKTVEDRDIMAVTIDMRRTTNYPKPRVIVEGGIHGREWISPAFVTFLIRAILNAPYSRNWKLKKIAYLYEWNFVPVLNPDGYEYTINKDRMWKKNRNGKYGVDINRNFGYEFGTSDISSKESSDMYCGPSVFSEQESKAMANFVRSKSERLKYYIAVHSYGQFFIIPYAPIENPADNYNEMKFIANIAAEKLQERFGTRYTVGNSYQTVGSMPSGSSTDWVKKIYEVPYVITFKLRDKGRFGYALPPKLILPTCRETMAAVLSLLDPGYRNRGRAEKPKKEPIKTDKAPKKKKASSQLLINDVILCIALAIIITV